MKEIVVKNRCVWVSAILGAITFMCIYGLNVLNPQYIDWLYSGGDLTQHYLGWVSYRNSRWFFPIGLMDQLTYPFRSSIIFSDSIPLMAVFFKCFSWVLPETFQYFGLWGIMTFALNGAFSAKILQKYLKKNWQIIFGSCFFILSFQVLARMYGHTALAAHWVILFAIYMLVYHDRNTFKTKMKLWALLGFLCSAIHIYFLLMCGLLLVGFCVIDLMDSSDMAIGKRLMRSIAFIVAFVGTALITVFLLGGFEAGISMENVGLGYYSLNINGFFDSQDIGLLTKGLPRGPGQYEGFSYLGFGMILMLGITGFEMLFRGTPKSLKQMSHLGKGMVVAFLLAIIVALSPIITCGSRILLTLRLPQLLLEIWRVFRASGRMAWVCIYLIFALCADYRIISIKKKGIIICAALVLQLIDVSGFVWKTHDSWWDKKEYQDGVNEEAWDMILRDGQVEHMVILDDYLPEKYYPLSIYAMENKITTDQFHLARNSGEAIKEVQNKKLKNMEPNTAFVWGIEDTLSCPNYNLNYYKMDGKYVVGLTGPINGLEEEKNIGRYVYRFSGNNIINGYDENGIRYIEPGGISYGPYIEMYTGKYNITISGSDLDVLSFECSADVGKSRFKPLKPSVTENEVSFWLILNNPVSNFEILLNNKSVGDTVKIESITIQKFN